MASPERHHSVSRRTALAGLSTAGLGLALTSPIGRVSAQDETPTAGHPIVGTWIFDRDESDSADAPTIVVFNADGGLLDPSQGVAGVWKPTGERTAAWTLIQFVAGGTQGYVAVRSNGEISDDDHTLAGPVSFTVIAPDGTVITSGEGQSTAMRLQVEPVEEGGKPLAGFPTWMPAPQLEATPAS